MIQLQFRRVVEDGFQPPEWSSPREITPGEELVIDNLTDGDQYEVRVRELYDDGSYSDWTLSDPVTAAIGARPGTDDAETPPPPAQNLRVEADGCLFWDHPEAPLAGREIIGYEVRQASEDYRNHDAAVDASPGLVAAPPLDLCGVPRGVRTLSVVAVYKSGERSEPAYLPVDRGAHDEAKEVSIETHNEHTGWSGTKTNFTLSAGTLVQDASTAFFGADYEPFFGTDANEFFANRVAEAVYQFSITPTSDPAGVDDGRILTIAPTVTSAPGWRLEYRRDDSRFFGPDADPFFGDDAADFFDGTSADTGFFGADTAEFFGDDTAPFFEDIQWRPWPGSLTIRAIETITARVVLPAGARTAGTLSTLTWGVSRPFTLADIGGSNAPSDADYLVKTSNGTLSAERVVTDGGNISWDWSTAGTAKAYIKWTILTKVAAYSATYGDLVNANVTPGSFSVTLPTAISHSGECVRVRRTDASGNTLTVDCSGGQTINGSPTKTIATQFEDYEFISDGANWMVF
jgi:hypothetical protein